MKAAKNNRSFSPIDEKILRQPQGPEARLGIFAHVVRYNRLGTCSVVIASLEASCQNGDLAVVVTADGEAMVKIAYYKGEDLLLKSTNDAYSDHSIPRNAVLHLHPIVYIRMGRM